MNNTIMYKEILAQSQCILKTKEYNNNNIVKLATAIKNFNPQNIVIVGRGTSMHAGIYAKHLLELYYHLPVSIAAHSIYTIYDSNLELSKSVVIAISQSGAGKDNLEVIKKAKMKGALTIAIVNELESPLAHEAEYVLYCNAGSADTPPATKTLTTTLYLITMLVYELTKNEALKTEDNELKTVIDNAISNYNLIKDKVSFFVPFKNILSLGRGLSLSLAMEAGLKIKETCHINVNAYPLSEFKHGSIIAANRDMPTIIFDFEKETRNDVNEIYERLRNKDIPVLLISNNSIYKNEDNCLYLQNDNPIYAYFEALIIIQLLACELSLAKGYDPDFYPKTESTATF